AVHKLIALPLMNNPLEGLFAAVSSGFKMSCSNTLKFTNSPSQLVPSTVKLTTCPSVVESVFQYALVKEH
ncbi:hypothetical protein LCGC14_1312200, partial [marine sediment metagenome]